jgi:hypothetical protein
VAEFEELKLQVTLVDNATAQIKTLQHKLGAESARGLAENFKQTASVMQQRDPCWASP